MNKTADQSAFPRLHDSDMHLPPPPSKSPSHDKHNQSARKVEASGSLPHDSAECNAYDGTVPALYGVWFLVCGWGRLVQRSAEKRRFSIEAAGKYIKKRFIINYK